MVVQKLNLGNIFTLHVKSKDNTSVDVRGHYHRDNIEWKVRWEYPVKPLKLIVLRLKLFPPLTHTVALVHHT
jgi:hypothetical protein